MAPAQAVAFVSRLCGERAGEAQPAYDLWACALVLAEMAGVAHAATTAAVRGYKSWIIERLQNAIRMSRAAGYAINDEDVLPGIAAIGVALRPREGLPYAAMSIAGISARFAGPRREELAQMLLKEVRAMEKKLNALDSPWG